MGTTPPSLLVSPRSKGPLSGNFPQNNMGYQQPQLNIKGPNQQYGQGLHSHNFHQQQQYATKKLQAHMMLPSNYQTQEVQFVMSKGVEYC